jgi:hypothetical protein
MARSSPKNRKSLAQAIHLHYAISPEHYTETTIREYVDSTRFKTEYPQSVLLGPGITIFTILLAGNI